MTQTAAKSYSGIIFDIDGTITHTNQLIYDTFNYVSDKYIGRTFTPREITAMFGPPEDYAIRDMVGESRFEQAMEDFYRYYKTHHSEKAGLYDGMFDILSGLKQAGFQMAVFTGKGRTSAEITIEELGLSQFFDTVVTGHDVVRHKPSGEGLLRALERMNLPHENALMVGDSVADVRASREAGIDIAAVLWDSYGHEEVLKLDTDYTFTTIGDFRRWIDGIIQNHTNNSGDRK
jgi:pyrophosphatase PpaX